MGDFFGAKLDLFGYQNRLQVDIDFTLAAWNTIASHEVFTVTGPVQSLIYYIVDGSLTSGGAATLSFGIAGSTSAYAAAQAYTALVAGVMVRPGSTVTGYRNAGSSSWVYNATGSPCEVVNIGGSDEGFEVAGAALTGGTMKAVCFWTPLLAGGLVVAGDGSSL